MHIESQKDHSGWYDSKISDTNILFGDTPPGCSGDIQKMKVESKMTVTETGKQKSVDDTPSQRNQKKSFNNLEEALKMSIRSGFNFRLTLHGRNKNGPVRMSSLMPGT